MKTVSWIGSFSDQLSAFSRPGFWLTADC